MTSSSNSTYAERAAKHKHPVARRIFETAEAKQSNLIVSADFSSTAELLHCADTLGPYMAVLKTHIDLIHDFGNETVEGLKTLSNKHNFMIFEDRKFVDIGNTVQKQYHGGALRISEFADIVNLSILGGDGIVEALSQVVSAPEFPYHGERAMIILADMTSKGSLATGYYTQRSVELARTHKDSIIGFIAMKSLANIDADVPSFPDEDFIVFTTGINQASKGDKLGQQYNTPSAAVEGGSDFLIAGRGVYATADPIASAKSYRDEGWRAYLKRVRK